MSKTPQELYAEREKRILDAISLKVPDRVPLMLSFGMFPARYTGMRMQEAYEDPDKFAEAMVKAHLDFAPDVFRGYGGVDAVSGSLLDSRQNKWPGHGLGPDSTHQYVEGEYMKAEEYDALLGDPSDFVMRTYWPRVFGSLEGFHKLPALKNALWSFGTGFFVDFNDPQIIQGLETIIKVARESAKSLWRMITLRDRMKALGFPSPIGFGCIIPFDVLSDNLRGLRGATLDMFRHADKIHAVRQKMLPHIIEYTIANCRIIGVNIAFIAMHRGSDGFMSRKQFETFYWPDVKTYFNALIEAGITPMVFLEGTWDQRLDYLTELPKGKVLGWFDRTDLFKAKEVVGGNLCIMGDMPLSLLQTGTPQQVKDYAKKLIDVVGRDGGYIMSSNTVLDFAQPELVKVWSDFTKEYGVYR
jgi:uroporphyrinogen-III decarboxylase